jgi:eukaryotic-like serine/threonine-protein kinase
MRRSPTILIVSALVGLGLTTAACGTAPAATTDGARSQSTTSAATPQPSPATTPPSAPATTPPPSPTTTPVTASTSPANAAGPPPGPASVPGVVADCTSAPPYRLSVRPGGITLACADNGLGVEKVTWSRWTVSAATGLGLFWEKLCQPSCAEGKIGYYRVQVRLSAVQTSAQGPWFSRLRVTWQATAPPLTTPVSYRLTPPGS